MTGRTISHFRVGEKIGEGGMGVVYRAEDTKLHRAVALKFLPQGALGDDNLRARFLTEAQAAASLNHPNVCTIFEIDEDQGFLAMELLEGDTVSQLLATRPLPVAQALDIAVQAGQALQAAHARSVVHRDIKSANIMLTTAGMVKIMDFGLAHLAGRVRLTRSGVALGTPAYMSHEQAQGKEVDGRTDLWSLGVVLYEMLTGRLPFAGDSEAAVLYGILNNDPEPPTSLRSGLPVDLDRIIAKALAKEPSERYQHAEDLLVDLQAARRQLSQTARPVGQSGSAAARARKKLWIVAVACAVAGTLSGSAAFWFLRAPEREPVRKFDIRPPRFEATSFSTRAELSRDGRMLAYTLGNRLWIRDLSQRDARVVEDSNTVVMAWSPDSSQIAFEEGGKVWRAPARGGSRTMIAAVPGTRLIGMAWGEDGTVALSSWRGSLYAVNVQGGQPRVLVEARAGREIDFHSPAFLPGGAGLVYEVHPATAGEEPVLEVFHGGRRKVVLRKPGQLLGSPAYDPSGYLLFQVSRTTYDDDAFTSAVRFSLRDLAAVGEPFAVAPDCVTPSTGGGLLAMICGKGAVNGQLLWLDRAGRTVQPIGEPQPGLQHPAIAPGGGSIAVSANEGELRDIWIYDTQRGSRTRLNRTTEGDGSPAWSPDGRWIAYVGWESNQRNTIWIAAAAASQPPRKFWSGGGSYLAFAPSFRGLLIHLMEPDGRAFHKVLAFDSLDKPPAQPVELATMAGAGAPRVSPDGRLVAYASIESGRSEVYVRPFPSGEGKWQVSVSGGDQPRWSANGREIVFRNGAALYASAVKTSPSFAPEVPVKLFDEEFAGIRLNAGFDVTADGQRFAAVRQDRGPHILIVENWAAEFEAGR